ncbi:UvrD-helicase domain-containing protein [Vogesella sp. XCS3]|uniref:UvrD-helicase domain-containing protein n=1 Tax=Vogesella sp. XCS3 TaxID=2877939 RepID=UPI001D0B1D7A|nr:PIF1 family ATP-dependent DNA helicase [Vogesella sp. XCS3]UDM18953.1 UvrD-helicase domain-containing protein [Vogesella sp. XCS3]
MKKPAKTGQQNAIISAEGRRIRVLAFAGTGKTFSLVEYTKERPLKRFLYLAFNKSVATEAQSRFPKNVVVKTTHGLGFPRFGSAFQHKLGNLREMDVITALGLPRFEYTLAAGVLSVIRGFCASNLRRLSDLPRVEPDILALAQKFWALTTDPNSSVVTEHDTYLKLYQLSNPILNYDCLLFDEAQDANPVTSAIVLSQQTQVVLVGDSHQQIYQFRGAKDALDMVDADITLPLTQSFRFGQGIADVANAILDEKGEPMKLSGTDSPVKYGQFFMNNGTLIGQTNMGLLDATIGKKNVHFVGGLESYRISLIEDAHALNVGRPANIRDRLLKNMASADDLRRYATETGDADCKFLVKILDEYGRNLPDVVASLRSNAVAREDQAGWVATTAHRSKGLEWDRVHLVNDFANPFEYQKEVQETKGLPSSEAVANINLAYVAVTRAKKELRLCDTLMDFCREKGLPVTDSSKPPPASPSKNAGQNLAV